ncbi:MAG TPA: hypothetical protein VID03_06895 [Acidimicrobiia bacterium]|jgi:hypothetical protein
MGSNSNLRQRAEELDIEGWADLGKKQLRKAVEAKESDEGSSARWAVPLIVVLVALALSLVGYYRRQHPTGKG